MHKFAFETIPHTLRQQQEQYSQTVIVPVELIRDVLGEKHCLRYLVERMEQYPKCFDMQYENAWQVLGDELALSRAAAGSTDLDDRILKLAIAELQQFLRTGDSSHIDIFESGHNDFRREKSPDFAATAETVLNERRSSGRRTMSVAQYFRDRLDMAPRAIEILHIANADGILNESEQYTLASWLRDDAHHAEMIPIMELLVKSRPDWMPYRTELMEAYFHSERPEQLEMLIAQTDAHFHDGGRWTESNVALLANGCNAVDDKNRAKHYFTEAIVIHQRTSPGSVLNDGTLSMFYQNLANAESALATRRKLSRPHFRRLFAGARRMKIAIPP